MNRLLPTDLLNRVPDVVAFLRITVKCTRLGLATLACPGLMFAQMRDTDLKGQDAGLVVFATAGGGLGSRGAAALLGSHIESHGWVIDVRYSKSMSSDKWKEKYAAHYALLLGHVLRSRRSSISAGIVKSKAWEVTYGSCSDCYFGDSRRGPTSTTADGFGPAVVAQSRTGPFWGVFALGVEIAAFFGAAKSVGINVALDIGRLQ